MYERKLTNDACGASISESCELQTAIQGFVPILQRQVKRLAIKRRRDNSLIREDNSIDRVRKEEERGANYVNNKHVLYIHVVIFMHAQLHSATSLTAITSITIALY